jgi:hypothetical protein
MVLRKMWRNWERVLNSRKIEEKEERKFFDASIYIFSNDVPFPSFSLLFFHLRVLSPARASFCVANSILCFSSVCLNGVCPHKMLGLRSKYQAKAPEKNVR